MLERQIDHNRGKSGEKGGVYKIKLRFFEFTNKFGISWRMPTNSSFKYAETTSSKFGNYASFIYKTIESLKGIFTKPR